MTTMSEPKTPVTLAEKFMAMFNLGDEGKVKSFYNRQRKKLVRSVAANERLMSNEGDHNYPGRMEVLRDELEDAQTALEGSYLKIDVKKLETNADQDAHAKDFWKNVDKHLAAVQKCMDNIKKEEEAHKEKMQEYQDQIDTANERIAIIDGTHNA